MDELLTALGLVLILEGAPYFFAPTHMRLWVARLLEAPDALLRRTGLALIVCGVLLVYVTSG